MVKLFLTSLMAIVQTATLASAHTVIQGGTLAIGPVWTRATPPGTDSAVGYARIENMGSQPDRLVGVEFGNASEEQLHQPDLDEGAASIEPIESILIPPGETVELKPGGYHISAAGLEADFAEGEEIEGALISERAGRAPVLFRVEALAATEPSPE